jgi:outer membrane protein assembly factor BamB
MFQLRPLLPLLPEGDRTFEEKGREEMKRNIAHAALAVALVAAALIVVLCVLLTATHLQVKRVDPLNNATLLDLRDRYEAGERSDQMKHDIRQLDLLARKAFFVSQAQIRTGGTFAIFAAVVMLVALGIFQVATQSIPPPSAKPCSGMVWINLERSRVWVACGTILLCAVCVVMSLSTPTSLSPELATSPSPAPPRTVPSPSLEPTVVHAPEVPALPVGFMQNAPVFRGAASSGQTDFEQVPAEWDESTKQNLLWKQPLPLMGWASPVVWGNIVVALGADEERREVYGLDAATGALLWTTKVPANAGATEGYVTDTMDERWDTLVYAGATPAVNGKQVFALFSNGQLLALNLADGTVVWDVVLGSTSKNSYGVDNSLLIYKDSVIVAFQGDASFIARYDATTGKQLWATERHAPSWGSPILARGSDGSYRVVLFGDPDLTAWDPETGQQLWSTEVLVEEPQFCVGPSAVLAGETVCVTFQGTGMVGVNLADGAKLWHIQELPDGSGFPDGASMTTDGTHIFQFFESVLTCVDAARGVVVNQKELDLYGNYSSALLNRGKLYLFGDGRAVVLNADPATDFALIGQGAMEDYSDATPALVTGRIYIRADESLYCFGTK